MENQSQSNSNQKKQINFNMDEFDIDSYDFKPVTKGLGFHGAKETKQTVRISEVKVKAPTPSRSLNRVSQNSRNKSVGLQNNPVAKPLSNNLMTGIDAIYNQRPEKKVEEVVQKPTQQAIIKYSSVFETLLSHIVDLMVVSAMTATLFVAFYGLVFKTIDVKATYLFFKSSWDFFGIFFGLVYLTYFTVLGPLQTLGQKLFSVSMRDENNLNSSITIKQSFIMSVISLLSLPLLLVPVIFEVHSKMAGAKAVKK